ncbi:hypothetical protein COLO4_27080 [Corchorus olitorius]|uniref:Uncharacterized protein n=1 Tax=Corchorus olitorius TaxID=93759 RepID=A0A1R3HSZ1_9ROSI|nr:hypothetical protein COLO4_27080 [Corchorus olitorius]
MEVDEKRSDFEKEEEYHEDDQLSELLRDRFRLAAISIAEAEGSILIPLVHDGRSHAVILGQPHLLVTWVAGGGMGGISQGSSPSVEMFVQFESGSRGSGRNLSVWNLPASECISSIYTRASIQDILAVGADPLLRCFDMNGAILSQIVCSSISIFSLIAPI